MIDKIIKGFSSPLQGVRIILSSPKNIVFSLIPFGIGLFVVGLGYFAASEFLDGWVSSLTEDSEFLKDWGFVKSILDLILVVIGWILVSLLNFLAGYLAIIIFAGPFYALMVENIFKKELPDKEKRSDLKLVLNMFLMGLGKALVFLLIGLVCLILAFIPGVNFLVPIVMVMTVAFDCSDYAFEVDFLSLRDRVRFFRDNFPYYLGLGLAILATGLIPGAFFVLLPVFVCGATKMYIQLRS